MRLGARVTAYLVVIDGVTIMSERDNSNPPSSHRLSNYGIGLGLFAILLFPPLFGLLGIVFGALGMAKGDKQRGITAIVVSVVGTILGSLAGGLAT